MVERPVGAKVAEEESAKSPRPARGKTGALWTAGRGCYAEAPGLALAGSGRPGGRVIDGPGMPFFSGVARSR